MEHGSVSSHSPGWKYLCGSLVIVCDAQLYACQEPQWQLPEVSESAGASERPHSTGPASASGASGTADSLRADGGGSLSSLRVLGVGP